MKNRVCAASKDFYAHIVIKFFRNILEERENNDKTHN